MNQYFEEFLEEFSPQIEKTEATPAILEKYKEFLPMDLLDFWANVGWSGYSNGLLWSTNPEDFTSTLECWLSDTNALKQDSYTVVARSAFGDIFLWGVRTGVSIIIHPLTSSITTVAENPEVLKGNANAAISAFFLSKEKKDFDFEDHDEKFLFDRALKKLGPLKTDEMYGFEPALSIGGISKLQNLVKVKMIAHLALLSQISPVEITHIDISRHI